MSVVRTVYLLLKAAVLILTKQAIAVNRQTVLISGC